MSSAPCIPVPCPQLGMEVKVSEIDTALHQLWEQDEARTNASLMNLVVLSEKPGSLIENSSILRELTREHACRAILTEVNSRHPEPAIRAWITAHCHLAEGRKTVCCEQIALHLTGRVIGRFRNTVFGHLNSDLPLVFWWQGELSELLSERLTAFIDRLIIDSSEWKDPAASFAHIESVSQVNRELVLHDHEWSRSWQFRLGIAGLFDDPLAQQALPAIERIEVVHHAAHRNAALQLVAWLAHQAGWRDRRCATGIGLQSATGREIEVRLIALQEGAPLASVTMQMGEVTVRVHQCHDHPHIERRIESGEHRVSSMAPSDPNTPQELVGAQLARGGRNTQLRRILPRYLGLLEALDGSTR